MIKKDLKELDVKNVNEVVTITKSILKIAYILISIAAIYAATLLFKEWKIIEFILTILTIVSPLFIGLMIAWLFDPFVTYLKKKKIRRLYGAIITYLLIFLVLFLVIGTIIPLFTNQINDLVKTIPAVFDNIQNWINNLFVSIGKMTGFDVSSIKNEIFNQIEAFGVSLTNDLPTMTFNFFKSFFSGLGIILVGLVIGFYILISFGNIKFVDFLPLNLRSESKRLINEIDNSLRMFVKGALYDSTLVFIITGILLWMVGLKAPLLFALFCGLTNVIPYAGPYIGGIPAIVFGFSQNPTIGLLTLAVIVVVQFIEGNFFQPIIMSRSTKLHPVTIILGLLIFGQFFGILGMFISTPIIAVSKSIFKFFDDKYDFFKFYI